MSTTRLFRSESDKMIAGVCGGLAAYLDIDPVLVRLGFVVLGFASGIGLPLYIAMAIITPTESTIDTESMIHFAGEDLSNLKEDEQHQRRNATFLAGLLIMAGAYFFFANLGFNIWPVALIALGIYFVTRRT